MSDKIDIKDHRENMIMAYMVTSKMYGAMLISGYDKLGIETFLGLICSDTHGKGCYDIAGGGD